MSAPRPGANNKKIFRQTPRLDVKKKLYSQRVAPEWNKLENSMIQVLKMGTFKKI